MSSKSFKVKDSLNVEADGTADASGDITVASNRLKFHNGTSSVNVVTASSTDTLTGKTIDADGSGNSITNIENADIKAGAAIARDKLASGTAAHVVINDGTGVMSSEATVAKVRGGTAQDNSSLTFPSSGTVPAITPNQYGLLASGSGADATVIAPDASTIKVLWSGGAAANPTWAQVTNAAIATSASITRSKTASGNNYRIVANDATGVMSENAAITASRAVASDANGQLVAATTTATELGYVNGVTSAIQTQLGTKLATTVTTTGDMIYSSSGSTAARLAIGSSGQVLSVSGGIPSWAAAPSGGINYIGNDDAETDVSSWATYADAAGNVPVNGTAGSPNTTWTRTTTNPLRGSGSFLWTKASGASRQGEGVSYDFTLDSADQAKICGISFDYIVASGTFTASDGITAPLGDGTTTTTAGNSTVQVFMYDVTNAVLIPVTPSVLTSNSTTTPSSYRGSFQTASNSTSYRLILHTSMATDAAMTAKFDNFYVGPDTTKALQGAPMEDWNTNRTFTYSSGFGTTSNTSVLSRRVGDSLQVRGYLQSGTVTATNIYVQLPSGLTLDTAKMGSLLNTPFGTASRSVTAAGAEAYSVLRFLMFADPAVTNQVFFGTSGASNAIVKVAGNGSLNNSDTVNFEFTVPISGWGSNVSMSNDTDTRVVAMRASGAPPTGTLNSSYNDIVYGTVHTDSHGSYASGTGIYTIPVSGHYAIGCGFYASLSGTGAGDRSDIQLLVNGSAVGGTLLRHFASQAEVSPYYYGVHKLTAGDTLKCQSRISVGANGYNASIVGNTFSVHRLSGPATVAASEKIVACYYVSANFAATTTTPINYDTKLIDTHSAVTTSASAWKFVAPRSGFYNLGGYYSVSVATSRMAVYKNGTIVTDIAGDDWTGGGSLNYTIQLAAGDYIDFRPGSNKTIQGGALADPAVTKICIVAI